MKFACIHIRKFSFIPILLVFSLGTSFCADAVKPGAADSDGYLQGVSGGLDVGTPTGEYQSQMVAADKLRLAEEDVIKAPEMLARYRSTELEALPLISHDISVLVVGHRVRVVQDLIFRNPSRAQLAGEFTLALPDGAVPTYLAMYQGTGIQSGQTARNVAWLNPRRIAPDRLLGATIRLDPAWQGPDKEIVDWGELRPAAVVQPEQGREIYEETTRRRIDPALSEWAGSNRFHTRIFPIAPRGHKRVVIAYDRPLNSGQNGIEYRLPVPDEIDAPTRLSLFVLDDTLLQARVSGPDSDLVSRSKTNPPSFHLTGDDDLEGRLYLRAHYQNQVVQSLVGRHSEIPGKLVHLRISPNLPSDNDDSIATGRAVFLIDTSYSAHNGLYNQSAIVLKKILESDNTITEFSVLAFDVRAHALTDQPVPNTSEHRAELFERIENLRLEGATNIVEALQTVSDDIKLKNADTYFLLSDGQITWGEDRVGTLRRDFPSLFQKRWITYAIGERSANHALFSELNRAGGRTVQIAPGQDLTAASTAHRMHGFRLLGVDISQASDLVVAGNPSRLYPGQVLEIAARVSTSVEVLEVRLNINDQVQSIAVPLKEDARTDDMGGRAWAQLFTERLLDLHSEKADEVALALSQRFSLNNRVASFIILETDEEYRQHRIGHDDLNLNHVVELARKHAKHADRLIQGEQSLNSAQRVLISDLRNLETLGLQDIEVWQTVGPPPLRFNLYASRDRDEDTHIAIYDEARDAESRGAIGDALRIVSTIVENQPFDDRAIRMTAFIVMQWGLYPEAAELFARTRMHRSFEPQNYILEAAALAANGRIADSALLYEIALSGDFNRFSDHSDPVAIRLYSDLLLAVINNVGTPTITRSRAIQRLQTLHSLLITNEEQSKELSNNHFNTTGRLVLFWNLDDIDMDLHVKEADGNEVYYEEPVSATGGRLHADNLDGLGPELYEHPTMAGGDFKVSVDYFGGQSIENMAPATTLLMAFVTQVNSVPAVTFHANVLDFDDRRTVPILTSWSR